MNIIVPNLVALIFLIIGFLIGQFTKKKPKIIGTLIVDPVNPEINGGVYIVWDVDPFKLESSQVIQLDVMKCSIIELEHSQQNQGV